MTARKTTNDVDQWFEASAIATIERCPTAKWETAVALWRGLPQVRPATRKRILRRLLEVASKRGEPWPAKLVRRFTEAAIPAFSVPQARGRVHDSEAMRKAAGFLAHHPDASWNDIAAAAAAKKGTVRQWRGRPDFRKYLKDEIFLVNIEMRKRLERVSDGLRCQHEKILAAPKAALPPK